MTTMTEDNGNKNTTIELTAEEVEFLKGRLDIELAWESVYTKEDQDIMMSIQQKLESKE